MQCVLNLAKYVVHR